jgi:pyroglutamyl-peptidase
VGKHILLAGFEPFAGESKVSPGELVARSLDGAIVSGRPVAARVIPVETRNIRERFEQALQTDQPEIVILLSQVGGRTALALERVAVNVLDFDKPDNVGVMRKNDVIARGGAEARISNLPLEKIVEAWSGSGVPGYVSNSAGTSIGNQALYEVLALTEHASPPVLVGLVNLPYLPAQAIAAGADSTPSMAFELMKKGIEVMIETLVPWVDQRASAGPVPSRTAATPGRSSTWIPRGVKEVER